MASDPRRRPDAGGELVVERGSKLERAKRYRVVFYNDHYTTKWFVIDVLRLFFHMAEATATAFMLAVHEQGKGVAGVFTRDVAETKVAQVMDYASEHEMPLRLVAEPEDD